MLQGFDLTNKSEWEMLMRNAKIGKTDMANQQTPKTYKKELAVNMQDFNLHLNIFRQVSYPLYKQLYFETFSTIHQIKHNMKWVCHHDQLTLESTNLPCQLDKKLLDYKVITNNLMIIE